MRVSTHWRLLCAAILLGVGLCACGGSEEAARDIVIREKNGPAPTANRARRAVNEALQAYNEYCIAPVAETDANARYPISLVNPSARAPSRQYTELWALTQVGLLDTTAARSNSGLQIHRFSLTKRGARSRYDIAQARSYQRMFCYAVPVVTRIDSIASVYNSGPNPLARVWFSYSYTDLGRWVNDPLIQRTFSGLESLPDPATRRRAKQLLVRVDSAWVDRRLTGYERPPKRSDPPSEQ